MRKRPTIEDVGRAAGVSQATVSYVLSGSRHAERITAGTTRRIVEAAQRIGYIRNATGTALKRGYTNSIVILLGRLHVALAHASLTMCISRAAAAKGLNLVVEVASSDEEASEYLMNIVSTNPYGIIVDSETVSSNLKRLADLYHYGIPVVDLNPPGEEFVFPSVTADRAHGFSLMTKHLIDLGHTRIGVILQSDGCPTVALKQQELHPTASQRMQGYRFAIGAAGIKFSPDLIEQICSEYPESDYGYDGFKHLLGRCPDITAVVCTSDRVALGAIAAARDMGLDVPGRISIGGYGGLDDGRFYLPSLTTLVPAEAKIAEKVIELMKRLRDEPGCKAKLEYEPMELIVRDSTGHAPAGLTDRPRRSK